MAAPYDEAKLQRLLSRVGELPAVPTVIKELDSMIEDPKTTADDLSDLLSTDPGLGSKIVRMANSPFYGIPRKVTQLPHAISLLGFNVIRNIALSAFMLRIFDSQRITFDPKKFWLHCIATGAGCRAIGTHLRVQGTDDLFLLGLLHDMGKLVIAQHSQVNYAQIVPRTLAGGQVLAEVETEMLGFNHCNVGGYLANHWQFPPVIRDIIENHHTPDQAEFRDIVTTVHFADIFARALQLGMHEDQRLPYRSGEDWTFIGGKPEDVGPVMDLIIKDMKNSNAVMDLFSNPN
ncbi:MAG: HDOD domain-containing protein [Planctomycetota bacterium]